MRVDGLNLWSLACGRCGSLVVDVLADDTVLLSACMCRTFPDLDVDEIVLDLLASGELRKVEPILPSTELMEAVVEKWHKEIEGAREQVKNENGNTE